MTPPPLSDLANRAPRLPATWALIAANLLVFAAMLWHGAGLWHSGNTIQLEWGANFGPATQDGQWWRLGSAMFLHFGLVHLGMNMLSLWDSGRLVERLFGTGRFLLLYFVSGLAGNLLSLIMQGGQAISGCASGAIFGVYGALMSFLWLERHGLHPADFRRLFWGAGLFSVAIILLGFQIQGIDNGAHIGGWLGGILAGLALARPIFRAPPARRRAQWLAGALLLLALPLLIALLPTPRYRWSEEVLAQAGISQFLEEETRINLRWGALLNQAKQGQDSFDHLAGQVESQIAESYENSFEQLARLRLDPDAPSAPSLMALREYAEMRRDAARELARGLREQDWNRIRDSLEKASEAARQTRAQDPAQGR